MATVRIVLAAADPDGPQSQVKIYADATARIIANGILQVYRSTAHASGQSEDALPDFQSGTFSTHLLAEFQTTAYLYWEVIETAL